MKLGIIGEPTEDHFQMASSKGLSFLEFCINVGNDTKEFAAKVKDIQKWMTQYNVGVASIGRWGTERINQEGKIISEELEASYELINAASEIGCKNFVCGCNYVEQLSYYENCTAAIHYFSTLMEYGKDKGVQISTYNCRWNNFVHSDPAWTMIHGHLKDLGIKFDPSHTRYAGGDYLEEMKKWGSRFNHVHIKGSLKIDEQRFDDPPAGLDETNWGPFMAILYAHKYTGGLSIEPHSHNWKGELGEKGVDFTIEYMKRLILT